MLETIHITSHARRRMAQRGITKRELRICLSLGEVYHRTGAVFFVLTSKVLHKVTPFSSVIDEKMNGLTAILHYDGEIPCVTTVYKNQNAVRNIRKKGKQNAKIKGLSC
ncbi:MAG: DUF4258 domain-containing protein [Candidatus Marinimicrobia bacterium]|nr:DUF4258 domain-containing protein [Candidatus Neomarinimicrobiota bacterium]